MSEPLLLKVILGPIAIGLFFLLIRAWWKIYCLEHDKNTLIAKVAEVEKHNADVSRQLTETRADKDAEIQRQQKQIEELRKENLRVIKLYATGKGAMIPASLLKRDEGN